MASVTFRRAIRADLPAIIALLADDMLGKAREILSDPVDPRYIAGFEAIEANPNDMLVVAEMPGRVVGCLQLTFLPGVSHLGAWRGQVEGVRVDASLRGSGIGRQMLGWAIERCRAKGCTSVQLTTNEARTDAQRFYKSLGFEASHVGMKLRLARGDLNMDSTVRSPPLP
jgi:ribosomal protein S18 acetylase RimI-like enzyme